MGVIRNNLPFVVGTLFGAYLVQNYDVPDIKKLVTNAWDKAKTAERNYRKRNKPGSD